MNQRDDGPLGHWLMFLLGTVYASAIFVTLNWWGIL